MRFIPRRLRGWQAPGWIAVAYGLFKILYDVVDAAGNVEFIAARYDGAGSVIESPWFLLLVIVGGFLWIAFVGNEKPEVEAPSMISIAKLKNARLEPRILAEVAWPVAIRDGEIGIGNPRCLEHDDELEHKPIFHFRPPRFDSLFPKPVVEESLDPGSGFFANIFETLPSAAHEPLPLTPEGEASR